ncbi:hypothetical protein SUGI_0991320 [Cryptomeria japonica]|uniref:uncharacterized protein LOC131033311 n=1 Tax=Cryptomeria japonica TaxID=3369 RepID=UPI00241480E3|nr:uncharacterized protein LOC131033311 [Cryptomeria japonica]GLJ46969.1 hypothetical protein SUGI_0991320 [Cryptomeria japonica]
MRFSVVELVVSVKRAYWASQGLKSRRIELSNGSTMHCLVKTSASSPPKPAVLLVHGFGADGLSGWDKQIGALGKHFDLYIPDLLFFGESTTRSSERSEIFQAECVKNMLDCLQVKSVMVVGHSYGGFVGFWMAHRFPELVRCLVIVSSGVCMTPSSNDDLLKEIGASDIRDVLLPRNVQDFKKCINHTVYKMPWLPNFIYKDFMESKGGRRNERLELFDGIVIGSKNAHPLPTLVQEVLIIWGKNDKIFKLQEAHAIQRHIGEKAKLVVIEECGHVPSIEKPAELNEQLLKFLLDIEKSQTEMIQQTPKNSKQIYRRSTGLGEDDNSFETSN